MALNDKDVRLLFDYARKSIEASFKREKLAPKLVPKSLKIKAGVFVTLETYPFKELRGCIGFVEPVPLVDGVINAAKSSAFKDYRFPPLDEDELNNVVIEISILSEPVEIKVSSPREYLEVINKGDGLILKKGYSEGLFLPQVWDQIPDKKRFLDELCLKAGLPYNSWMSPGVKIYRFSVEAWCEEKPGGKVVNVKT